jgi:ribosomal protein S18 acetylase RimI-like enzyme
MEHILDNPVWHALNGPHASVAIGFGRGRHYPRDMAPFSAIAQPDDASYADLAADLPRNTEARLFRPAVEPLPAGWHEIDSFPMLQMVAEQVMSGRRTQPSIVPLDEGDIGAMLELVAIAKPGPFGTRTPSLGRYLGVRDGERLVAMAGIRMRLPGFDELSAIAVHPDARGRGCAASLARKLMCDVLDEGRIPFLHVRPDNAAALSLYRALGFVVRREIVITWRKPQSTR